MEELIAKLKTFLHIETELPIEGFSAYYKDLVDYLNTEFENLDQDALLQARYICSIVQANAGDRAKQSKASAKVFKKMSLKCSFWSDAISFRLQKNFGLSQVDMDSAMERINESM